MFQVTAAAPRRACVPKGDPVGKVDRDGRDYSCLACDWHAVPAKVSIIVCQSQQAVSFVLHVVSVKIIVD